MRAMIQIARWGNSLVIRLIRAVGWEARIEEGDTAEVCVQEGAIIVRPAQATYRLEELVGQITVGNRNDETDWGSTVGQEQ